MTEQRFLGALGYALLGLALWSMVGVIAALLLDDSQTAWRFVWALIGSGATMIAIGIYQGRHHA